MATIVPVSGGWDSALTWLFVTGHLADGCSRRWQDPDAVAVFTDPGHEDARTYAVLDLLDAMTGRPIVRLQGPTWEEALEAHSWFLPWHRARWCTPTFKIRPFEAWVSGLGPVVSCIGLRADEPERAGYQGPEHREGLGERGSQITPVYPLREMGITYSDRQALGHKIGLPEPAPWSCFNCPFKTHFLWVTLVEQYPEQAEWCAWVEEEKERRGAGGFGWIRKYKIRELMESPQLRADIRRRYWSRHRPPQPALLDAGEEEATPCLLCRVK